MSTLIINDGFNPDTGVQTRTHFADGEMVVEKIFDAEPHLEYARKARESTEGQRWGNGRMAVHLPPAVYAKLLMIGDPEQRKQFIRRFARENQQFVMFDRYLK